MPITRRLYTALFYILFLMIPLSAADNEIIKLEANASFYGKEFDGRPTSSGEIFDMNALTAAHKTLPFGTLLEITNLANGKRVTVRVNDRGPFVANREIDLSYGAAIALDMIGAGVAKVSIRRLSATAGESTPVARNQEPAPTAGKGAVAWRIQLASFSSGENAERMAVKLRAEGFNPSLETAGGFVRVIIASLSDGELETMKARLTDRGYRDWLVRRETP